ncbi:MAG TPA: hypothetical protein VMM56_10010 [Planctomycetaceae bacterium]|nr:hypothetical protein [Planctomycetaceae bacterium]
MNPSHMPVHHFIAQLDRWKSEKKRRATRPSWLNEFIDRLAELFEPLQEVARVGFDCYPSEEGWQIGMFLGQSEIVGGPLDGKAESCPFTFDLQALKNEFDSVDQFRLFAISDELEEYGLETSSFVSIRGSVQSERVTVRVFSLPPDEAGIGLKNHHIDGRFEPV